LPMFGGVRPAVGKHGVTQRDGVSLSGSATEVLNGERRHNLNAKL
jgi:hypothetical protein